MPDINLTQSEANALIVMEKHKVDEQDYDYPSLGGSVSIPLVSSDKRESFLLDIGRGRIDLLKGTYQNRARQIVVLVRLDFGGPPHRNPDGEEVPCPHLHIYREGFGDKWAVPAPTDKFSNIADLWHTLGNFMQYCNITDIPNVRKGLFS
jgi:hypothetical protein